MRKLLAAVSLFLLCACGSGETKIDQYAQMIKSEGWSVTICHFPPGNEGNVQTITVGHPSVLKAHLKHGDHLGECTCEDLDNCEPQCEGECCYGQCVPRCGDEVCHLNEDCETCPEDCGECPPPPPFCGDESCDIGESCENCAEDCGACPPPPCTENCGSEPDAGVPDAGTPPTNPPEETGPAFAVTGGCNASGFAGSFSTGLGFLVLVCGFLFVLRKKWIVGIVLLILGLLLSGSVYAFPTQNFKPAAGSIDYWTTEDAKVSLPSVSLLWHYENDPVALENLNTGDKTGLINHRHTLHILGAYSFYNRIQFMADIPLVLGQWNGDLSALGTADPEGGVGNVRLGTKVRIATWKHLGLGVGLDVGLPTSTVDYVDDAGFTITPKAIVSSYIGPVFLAINAGVEVRDPDSYTPAGIKEVIVESDFVGSAAVNWAIWSNDTFAFNLVSDIFLSVPLRGAEDRTLPVEWINGVQVGLPAGFQLNAGAGVGLTSGVGAPDYRILGGLTWTYEPQPDCVLQPVYEVTVVKGPPIVEEVPVPVPVPIINPVYFPFDKHELTLEAQATLLDDIDAIRQAQRMGLTHEVIIVIGRTDKRGSDEYNIKLAERRAKSVEAFLLNHGFAQEELKIQVDGEAEANQETEDELEFQRDRTVILHIVAE